jgi:dienelactone hydrolase
MRTAPIVALSLLLTAGAAAAQDRCLTGASTVDDQRDLAALRVALDAACPGASFDGAPGNDRSAYRRCAREARDAALASGGLRKQCRMVATRGYFDTTCGTMGKVACGRVTPGARKRPVTCAVKPADRCASRARFTETPCTAETHCSDVVDWTAGTCVDVRDRLPFQAGVRNVTFTKSSVVDPMQQRALATYIWYPTDPGAGPVNGGLGAVVDAPLDASGGPYPMLLFSHGSCGFPTQSVFLTALLAAQGFVVVAPPHPGNTLSEFPNCGTFSAQLASVQERPQDMVFVLDQMLAESANPSSPFFGAVDPERIGMSGHSFGGLTTYLVQDIEPRVKVAIPMAPAVGGQVLDVPSLTMLGQIDSVVSNAAIRDAYARALPPKVLIEIERAGHYAFSGLCFPSSDCNPPTTLTQDEAHGHVLRWVRPFLELYLNDDQGFAPFFLAPEPGVVFASETE